MREALARGFDLSLSEFVAYLDGRTELTDLPSAPTRRPAPAGDPERTERTEDPMIQVQDPSGRTTGVPLSELVRAHHLITRMGGFEVADEIEKRVVSLEERVAGNAARSQTIERRQTLIEKQLAKLGSGATRPRRTP